MQQSIRYADQYDAIPRLIDALLAMGDLHLAQEKPIEAVSFLERAVKLARKNNYPNKEYQAWFRLARSWKEKDEQEFIICTRNMYEVQDKLEPKEVEVI